MKPINLAKELAEALRESEEYREYQEAKKKVDEHEAAKIMLEDFRKKQLELEKKRLAGEEIPQAEMEKIKKLSEIITYNPYLRDYLLAEVKLQQLMMEIQKIIASGIGLDLPGFEENEKEEKK